MTTDIESLEYSCNLLHSEIVFSKSLILERSVDLKDSTVAKYAKDIQDILESHNQFLITTHIRADGDAIGSELALYCALRQMGKSVAIANNSFTPRMFEFLTHNADIFIYPEVPSGQPEVVFVLDCPTRERLGKIQKIIPDNATIINIDHHISSEYFGDINWVASDVCATGEIILSLLRALDIEITGDIATALYVAIVTDTGRFVHSNTTPESLRVAAFLIDHGANHSEISKHIYNANTFHQIRLQSLVLDTIKLHLKNQVATICLTNKMLEKSNVNALDTYEFSDIPVSVNNVSVGVFLRETTLQNRIKISLRSRNGFDVNAVAKKFGGGGHKYAAGCEIDGEIDVVQQLIIDVLKAMLFKE
ncbi:MAG: bifunctional oligoribonuclease/PAP phosphatase NrnA [Planctomycetes bacterium]|nr:bifunctional oligoribonuclease/PAP phosphatase NrnA [Planctomycetota bacterium]